MEALYLDARLPAGGQRFVLYHAPQGTPRGTVVAVYPFAEEMNKSRRMIGLGARALAGAGYSVVLLDLAGCGDSTGDLADASWDDWQDDVAQAVAWALARGPGPLWLWGTRAGALVAADAARRRGADANLLLWQPQSSGRQVLQQFLRLKMASQMQDGAFRGLTESLQKDLAAGRSVEVAGYCLGPRLAQGLATATLAPADGRRRVLWLEVTTREPAQLLPGSEPVLRAWREAGHDVHARVVGGPPFWQTLDIEDAPQLVVATAEAMSAAQPA